jgi:acyl-CoA dehydrogenase
MASRRTMAVKDWNQYVTNGQKTFISNGLCSSLVILAAKKDVNAVTKAST